jgi:hypothetical protein
MRRNTCEIISSKAYSFIDDAEIKQLGQLDVGHTKSNATDSSKKKKKLKLLNSKKR